MKMKYMKVNNKFSNSPLSNILFKLQNITFILEPVIKSCLAYIQNNSTMIEDLHPLIKQAAKSFKEHNYKKALELYRSCVQNLQSKLSQGSSTYNKSQLQGLLLNLYSSKAACQYTLKKYDDAFETVQKGLRKDIYHSLLLLRRSMINKKKNKIKEAVQDLQLLMMFSPDNLQLSAMRLELDNILLKTKGVSSQQGQAEKSNQNPMQDNNASDDQIDLDEEAALNFSNLKIIDRPSIRMSPMTKGSSPGQSQQNSAQKNLKRESHVTLSGDSAFFYENQQDNQNGDQQNLLNVSVEKAMQKYKEIEKYLLQVSTIDTNEQAPPIVKCKFTNTGKSILKNRNSQLYIDPSKNVYKSSQRSSFIDRLKKLKDIDGKVILPQQSGKKEGVGFRKSISVNPNVSKSLSFNPPPNFSPVPKKNMSTFSRKSCLKRSSFECPEIVPVKAVRKSKFDFLSKMSIDGGLIKHEDRVDENRENQRQSSQSDDDQGSSHNIYGSQFILSKQIRQNFGLDEQSSKKIKEKKQRSDGKSIMRKDSMFSPASNKTKGVQVQSKQPQKKSKLQSKKSVMFSG